jgi:hypothetical protein
MKQYNVIIVARQMVNDAKVDNIISEKSLPVRLEQAIRDILGSDIDPSLLCIQVKTV